MFSKIEVVQNPHGKCFRQCFRQPNANIRFNRDLHSTDQQNFEVNDESGVFLRKSEEVRKIRKKKIQRGRFPRVMDFSLIFKIGPDLASFGISSSDSSPFEPLRGQIFEGLLNEITAMIWRSPKLTP